MFRKFSEDFRKNLVPNFRDNLGKIFGWKFQLNFRWNLQAKKWAIVVGMLWFSGQAEAQQDLDLGKLTNFDPKIESILEPIVAHFSRAWKFLWPGQIARDPVVADPGHGPVDKCRPALVTLSTMPAKVSVDRCLSTGPSTRSTIIPGDRPGPGAIDDFSGPVPSVHGLSSLDDDEKTWLLRTVSQKNSQNCPQ